MPKNKTKKPLQGKNKDAEWFLQEWFCLMYDYKHQCTIKSTCCSSACIFVA